LLCKEENVRAGRITAAGKMKETVVGTVHKGAMKTMDSSKIMDDRVDSRLTMDTVKKKEEEGCKVDSRAVMDSVAIMVVNKDMVECRVVTVDMDNKVTNGDKTEDLGDSREVLAAMAMKDNMANRAAMAECRVDMVSSMETNMKTRIMMKDMMKIMMKMKTAPACRDAMAVKKMKTMTTIGI
jgi:hypothetical protein